MHLCGDILIDITIFKETKRCCMAMVIENSSPEMKGKSYCHDD